VTAGVTGSIDKALAKNEILAIDVCSRPFPAEIAELFVNHKLFGHAYRELFRRSEALEGIPMSQTLDEMNLAGTQYFLVCGIEATSTVGFEIPNEWVARVVEEHPDRFIGGVAVDPHRGMEAVREIERYHRDHGFKFVKVAPFAHGIPPNHRLYYPIYSKCVELDIPIWTQVGHTGPLLPSEPGRPIHLDNVCLEFPELRVVAGHIGWPWTEEMLALARKHPNLYVGSDGHAPRRYPKVFVEFINGWGRTKVVFGTDYPLIPLEKARNQVEDLGLSDDAKRKFLRDNAVKVFKLDEGIV